MPTISPCLWFDTQAEEAAAFYVSVFDDARIVRTTHYGEAGPREADMVLDVQFEIDGQRFSAVNGGPQFTFNPAVSLQIDCASQDDVDRYWERLTADGGAGGHCGWITDKFGVSWQVVPAELEKLLADADEERAQRAMAAMLAMHKIDIAAVVRAADGG